MGQNERRLALLKGISEQLRPVLDNSPQAIFVCLDDTHKVCNRNFSSLLGYRSAETWAATEGPLADIVDGDIEKVTAAYENATRKMTASALDVRFQNVRNSKIVQTRIIMVPVSYGGQTFVLNFVNRT